MTVFAALSTDETLLVLKGAFLVLLYVFILLVARTATKDLAGAPQESIILGPAEAEALRAQVPSASASATLVVVVGPGRSPGSTVALSGPTVAGRDAASGVRLDADEFASSQHARLEPARDGVWVEDLGSTNGTFVEGEQITGRTLLRPGETVRVGQTELRLER